MGADGAQELSDQGQRGLEVLRIGSETDPEVPVHVEEISGGDEDALFLPQALGQLGRAHAVRVAHEGDRSRFRRDVAETRLPLDPAPDQRVVRADDAARPRDQRGAPRRRECDAAQADR
jgi:hypothetical protein